MNSQNKQSENQLIDVLDVITRWLELRKIPYMVFGGGANSLYGNPRQKDRQDIDALVNEQRSHIDWKYLLSRFMGRSEIITKIRQLKDET